MRDMCDALFQSEKCLIDGRCYNSGDVNSADSTELCRPSDSTTEWTSGQLNFQYFVICC